MGSTVSILHLNETQALLDRLLAEATNLSDSESKLFNEFVRHYYYSVPYDNLSERDLFDLRGAALAHWQLGKQRSKGETKIRLYVPEVQRDGWRSNLYILEVVADDKPFLVDSISLVFKHFGLKVHLSVHPVLSIQRDKNGVVDRIGSALQEDSESNLLESYLHYQFDNPNDADMLAQIQLKISHVLNDIKTAVSDWSTMRQHIRDAELNLKTEQERRKSAEFNEQSEFCNWLERGNFTLLGYCEFQCNETGAVKFAEKSTLGILRNMEDIHSILPRPEIEFLEDVQSVIVTKASMLSSIQRSTYMDLILIPKFSATGICTGIRLVLGLFASPAYNGSASLIPYIRQKLKRVIERSRLSETTHSVRVLTHIMDNYPRDILFQSSHDSLFEDVVGILEQQDRQGVKIFLQREQYGRFYSAIVYIPREVFNRALRIKLEKLLMKSLRGTSSEFNLTFSEAAFARINYVIYTDHSTEPIHTVSQLQSLVEDASINWKESFRKAAIERFGERTGELYYKDFEDAFSAGYQEHNSPWVAAAELDNYIALNKDNPVRVRYFRPLSDTDSKRARLKLFSYMDRISPSDALPVLENLGLRVIEERPHVIQLSGETRLWVYEFTVEHSEGLDLNPDKNADEFEESLVRIWLGEAESDSFNKLVLAANLSWRQVVVLRAYSRFLKQIGVPYSETYITKTLTSYIDMSAQLVELFELLFDIGREPVEEQKNALVQSFEEQLDAVSSLDDDVILRSFQNAILSTTAHKFLSGR